jgi:hypothetical protein
MDAASNLLAPVVVAAVISALVAMIGFWVSARIVRNAEDERAAFEREQVERRVYAEISLAEEKTAFDRTYEIWKRRTELAERVLADFYKARDVIEACRFPAAFPEEGKTPEKKPWESDEDTRILNTYVRTAERLWRQADFFSQLVAHQYHFMALFGHHTGKPFIELSQIRSEILSAVNMLILTYEDRALGNMPDSRKKWEEIIGRRLTDQDPIGIRLNRVVEDISSICRPIILEERTELFFNATRTASS